MARLIEVQQTDQFSAPLAVRVGDVLVFQATGARISDGESALEVFGPFVSAVVGESGAVLAPTGFPNAVLARAALRARQPSSCSRATPFTTAEPRPCTSRSTPDELNHHTWIRPTH